MKRAEEVANNVAGSFKNKSAAEWEFPNVFALHGTLEGGLFDLAKQFCASAGVEPAVPR